MTAGAGPAGERTAALAAAVRDRPADVLVAVDVDGTLAPIVERPEDARAVEGVAGALRALARRGVTVALLTGRPALEAVRIVGLTDDDRVIVLGQYGIQRWRCGQLESPPVATGVEEARRRLPELLADAPEGVHVEDKEHALVVHTRPAADPAAAAQALTEPLRRLAEASGLELLPGRAVLELRPPGVDKGSALGDLAAEVGAAAGWVVYVGDDVADLAAFERLRVLAAEGRETLAVASVDPDVPDSDPRVAEVADLVLPGPSGVVDWLARLGSAA